MKITINISNKKAIAHLKELINSGGKSSLIFQRCLLLDKQMSDLNLFPIDLEKYAKIKKGD